MLFIDVVLLECHMMEIVPVIPRVSSFVLHCAVANSSCRFMLAFYTFIGRTWCFMSLFLVLLSLGVIVCWCSLTLVSHVVARSSRERLVVVFVVCCCFCYIRLSDVGN